MGQSHRPPKGKMVLPQTKAFVSQFVLQKDVLMGGLHFGGGVVQLQGD